jgi:hypothetical protein
MIYASVKLKMHPEMGVHLSCKMSVIFVQFNDNGMWYKTSVHMHGKGSFVMQSAGMESGLKNAIIEEKNVKSLPIPYHNQCNLVYEDMLLKSSAFTKIEMVCAKSSVPILIFMDMCTDKYSFKTVTRFE